MLIGMSLALSQARSGVSAGGGAQPIAYDETTLFGDPVRGDDFSRGADLTALKALWVPEYPDFSGADGCSLDAVVTFGGRRTLRIPEAKGSSGFYLELTNGAAVSTSDLWMRTMWRIPSTFAANANRLLFGSTGAPDYSPYIRAQYNINHPNYGEVPPDSEAWKWEIGGGEVALATLKNRWVSLIVHMTKVGADGLVTSYLDGSLLGTPRTATVGDTGFAGSWGLIDMDCDLQCDEAATPDPTNNYLNIGLFEYVDGEVYPEPYVLA